MTHLFLVVTLTICLGGVVTTNDDKVLGPVVVAAAEVLVEDGLSTGCVTDLGVDGGSGHVGNHGVSTTPARLEGLGDILLDNDGTTSGVYEP
jgi:hypothetical protein